MRSSASRSEVKVREALLRNPAGPFGRLMATLTATSADDGCGRWVVVVAVGRAEGIAEGIYGLASIRQR